MTNYCCKNSVKKFLLISILALIGTIFFAFGFSLTINADAQTNETIIESPDIILRKYWNYTTGLCELDKKYEIKTYTPTKGKNCSSTCNVNFFNLYGRDPQRRFTPKEGYYWCNDLGIYSQPLTHFKCAYNLETPGTKMYLKMDGDEKIAGLSFTNDKWTGGISGISETNQKVGSGLLLFRTKSYDKNLNSTFSPYVSISDLHNSLSQTGKEMALPIETLEESDLQVTICYELMDKSGPMSWDKDYYNLRSDYEIHFRNNTNDLFLKDTKTNAELTNNYKKDGIPGKTKNGFYFDTAGNKFYKVKYKRNGGSWITLSNSQMKIDSTSSGYKTITEEGRYEIQYTNAFGYTTYEQTVYVDRSEEPAWEAKNRDYSSATYADVINRKYYKNEVRLSWETEDNKLPWTATFRKRIEQENEELYGAVVSYNNGELINIIGDYQITFTNGLFSYSFEFTVFKDGDYIPNLNYRALKGEANRKNVWNYKSKYFGLQRYSQGKKLLYAYSTYEEATQNLALNIFDREVVIKGSTWEYGGSVYTSNEVLMRNINTEVRGAIQTGAIKQYHYDPDVEQTIIYYGTNDENGNFTSSLYDDTIYLNNYLFYKFDDRYSGNLYFMPIEKDSQGNYLKIDLSPNNLTSLIKSQQAIKTPYELVNMGKIDSGKYIVIEENIFGDLYGFEAYGVQENETEVEIKYKGLNDSTLHQLLNKNFKKELSVKSFSVVSVRNILDPEALVRIKAPDGKIFYAGVGESLNVPYTNEGSYEISIYDRFVNLNKSIITTRIVVGENNGIDIIGAENFQEQIANDVTIYFEKTYMISAFTKNGDDVTYPIETEGDKKKIVLHQSSMVDTYYICLERGAESFEIILVFKAI